MPLSVAATDRVRDRALLASADQIARPTLRQLFVYWNARRGRRDFPSRADIDVLELRFVLGELSLIDVLYEPTQFRFRVVGTHVVKRLGWELTGRTLEEIPDPQFRDLTRSGFEAVLRQRQPLIEQREIEIAGARRRYELVRLPLSEDGTTINMLMAAVSYFEKGA